MEQGKARDVAIWVGSEFYPTPEHYIREAEKLGCCRKVPRIPEGIVLGESKCFLFHKKLKEQATKKKKAKDHRAVIFGYFVIDGLVA